MKCSVIALDYDGTIALHDEVDPGVREAVADARRAGIVVLLVTGRILDELRTVARGLHWVDGVVAENGAVVHFPDSNHTTVVAPSVPPALPAAIARHGIPFVRGECLIDADADDGERLLRIVRELELPSVLVFNRSRVMLMPQGVSKATGLRATLRIIRMSAHNMVGIGDAENDHELLRLSEVGAAVEWGSASLREAADDIIPGDGPPAVADYIRRLARSGRVPLTARARRRLVLGYTERGDELALAIRGRNVLVCGDAKSGKSWIAGLLCEQLILQGYSVCAIDPEGDYRSLEALPGVRVLGGGGAPPPPRDLLSALRYPDTSLVIDLSQVVHHEKIGYINAVLPALKLMRRRSGVPHRVLVDEAHYFLHDAGAAQRLDFEHNGYILVTYRASHLPQEVLAASEVVVVTCESDPVEIDALRALCVACDPASREEWHRLLPRLGPGQAVALPMAEEAGGALRLFQMAPRLTPHVRHREKYVDVPIADGRAFVFSTPASGSEPRVRTLREFVHQLEHGDASELGEHARRGDFSRWIADVFGDRPLADELHTFEERWRRRHGEESIADMVNAIRARYDLSDDVP